ncbi:MAG: hypothetical protein KZQ85_04505 [Candidatus Thiodiazotropha sp. (ex Myrtea sp. 'scaly one' KF741663)]|nr:hypothetical protein [Candidatus Thiodiazotropha sp. (ex Myrtea sp. 'scaly one' KF741663)]
MSQRLHTGRLVLTPKDPSYLPNDLAAILEKLQSIGLINGEVPGEASRYLPGDRFMQLVTFMGCSPSIQLEPSEADEPYCYLTIAGPYESPRLIYGKNTTPPRCESCRKRITDWRTAIKTWRNSMPSCLATCPHCGHQQNPTSYDWRQSAGSGRLFLLIEHIFPQEAIPAPALIDQLCKATDDQPWHYFYQQEDCQMFPSSETESENMNT